MAKRLFEKMRDNVPFWVCLLISAGLMIGGAITPPPFVIDSSIFVAVGELFAFAALYVVYTAIKEDKNARITHGDTTIEINSDSTKNDDEKDA